MIPVGYMASSVCGRPDWLKVPNVVDIYSLSGCISEYFISDYVPLWKHNGYWLFDSPQIIRSAAEERTVDLQGTMLFFYEAHEMEFVEGDWRPFSPEPSFPTNIVLPPLKKLEGFDVVTFSAGHSPECSPLSCNSLAEELPTNSHCLFDSFDYAETSLTSGKFVGCELGPYRIFAVYSVDWP
jgi:hypothetical protein